MITFIWDAYYKIHITNLCMWIHLEINRKSKIFTMYSMLRMFLQTVYKWTFRTVFTGLKTDGKIYARQTHFSNMPFSWLTENKHFNCKILSHTIIVYMKLLLRLFRKKMKQNTKHSQNLDEGTGWFQILYKNGTPCIELLKKKGYFMPH